MKWKARLLNFLFLSIHCYRTVDCHRQRGSWRKDAWCHPTSTYDPTNHVHVIIDAIAFSNIWGETFYYLTSCRQPFLSVSQNGPPQTRGGQVLGSYCSYHLSPWQYRESTHRRAPCSQRLLKPCIARLDPSIHLASIRTINTYQVKLRREESQSWKSKWPIMLNLFIFFVGDVLIMHKL